MVTRPAPRRRRAVPLLAAVLGAVCMAVHADTPPELGGWRAHPRDTAWRMEEDAGEPHIAITVAPDQEVTWRQVFATLPVDPAAVTDFHLDAEVRLDDVRGGHGAVLSIAFVAEDGRRIAHVDSFAPPGVPGWLPLATAGRAPAGTHEAHAVLTLHGTGEAVFRRIRWRAEPPPAPADPGETVSVTLELAHPVPLVGFGAEDDGWFYNARNAEMGVDAAAIALRERRLRHIRPSWTRMFFWYRDWDPGLDGEHFTFDSDNMESHCRTLALYQELGTRVSGCGVEWGMQDRLDDPARVARSVGALLEYLIKERGFTCIRDWTFTNEPNLFFAKQGYDFAHFVAVHEALRAEFGRRGLDVQLVGSDDGDGLAWFHACARNPRLDALVDRYASHVYLSPERVPFARAFTAARVSRLRAIAPEHPKPFVIAEFGLADERMQPPDTNPYMREYGYALHTMACAIDHLNAGAAGLSVWCLQEVYYPGGKKTMEFGLWDFGGDWGVRPVYHAVACLARHTRAGDPIRPGASTDDARVKAVAVGKTLFWANLDTAPRALRMDGLVEIADAFAFTGPTPADDRAEGQPLPVDAGVVTLPPRSFGRATIATR